ncbi:MAG: GumC family protein, partial [Deltaproteobacteria bacterium]|nr:GumC family protein [Deltaproteobacteria bacterium]
MSEAMSSPPAPIPQVSPQLLHGKGEVGFDIRSQLLIIWSHRRVLVLVAGLIAGGVALWTIRQPKVYEAVCSLEYDPAPPKPLGTKVEDVTNTGPIGVFASREFYETQNRVIASRVVAEMVVRRFGLHRDVDFMDIPAEKRLGWKGASIEEAAEHLRSNLKVEQIRETRVVLIKFRDRNPERAQRVANAIADAYIEKTVNDRMSSTISAIEWLGGQVDQLQQELKEADEALHRFKLEHDVLSLSMEDRQNLIANEIELLSRSLTETRIRKIELSAKLNELRKALQTNPLGAGLPESQKSQLLEELRVRLRTKLAEYSALGTRYGPAHPQMVAIQTEIEQIRRDLEEEVKSLLRACEAELERVQNTEQGLALALERAHQKGIELNRWGLEYARLVRERESKAAIYDLVLKR